jgi:hypothetical protein
MIVAMSTTNINRNENKKSFGSVDGLIAAFVRERIFIISLSQVLPNKIVPIVGTTGANFNGIL